MIRPHPPRRVTALAASCLLVGLSTSIVTSMLQAPGVAAASPAITVTGQAPATVLAGNPVTFTLTAANPAANAGSQPEYNTTLREVLPVGVAYQSGSTTPADAGEPTVLTDPGNGQQTLIWSDLFDLPTGSSDGLSFAATTSLPVGSTVVPVATAYASTAPRYVAHFSATGLPIADPRIQVATSTPGATVITALQLSKTEASPDAKLLRGLHQHPTTYTLRLSNTSLAATTGVTVQDYLPAALEFLGCGQLDNTSGAAMEYPGAPRLTATPAVGANCLAPSAVDTVLNPPPNGTVSYPPGIYTKLSWTLGTLAAGQSSTIRYAAAVGLKQNVLFSTGPSPASLGQAANLDNNTGAGTRQLDAAATLTSYAHAGGSYTGPAVGGAASVSDTSHRVSVHDLRIGKAVTGTQFVAGAVSDYTVRIDSGEYADNSALSITDVLPNGLCPLDQLTDYAAGAPADCAPAAGHAPSQPYQSVTQNADGSFTVVFAPLAVPRDGSLTISYPARNRAVYTGGSLAGVPPAAGDSFANTATGQASAVPLPATGVSGNQAVRDASSATLTSTGSALAATVAARSTPMQCSDPATSYGTGNPIFLKGDRICFQLRVDFTAANQTRNAVLTDFLPPGTGYSDASVSYPAANTVDPAQIGFDAAAAAGGVLSWSLGAGQPDGSTMVAAGAVFVVRFSVLVTAAAAGPAPDKPGNIAKLRSTDSAGTVSSLRGGADFRVAAAPPATVAKGVASVNGAPPAPGPGADHVLVREGDSVTFDIEVGNAGAAATGNAVDIDDLQLWDLLPAGLHCAQVGAIGGGGSCTDPGAPGQPSFTGNATLSALRWNDGPLAAGASTTHSYTVNIPAGVSVSTVFDNTAALRSYTAGTDQSDSVTYYPAANVDSSVLAAQYDAPAASDGSDVYLRDVSVSSAISSAVAEAGNAGAETVPVASTQATIGEQLSLVVTARVPAGSSVYNGSFSSPLPAGLSMVSATAGYTADATLPADQPLPAGFSFDPAVPGIRWPAGYDNTTGTDQLFAITVLARLAPLAANQHAVVRTSTATFSSATAGSGGSLLPARTGSSSVTDVEPAVSLIKTNDAGTGVSGGQLVGYTVRANNAAGRPPLHDGWLADCLPAGLTFAGYSAPPAGVSTAPAVPGDGSNGCPAGTTLLSWNLADLAGGTSRTVAYTATVDPSASGKDGYLNLAALTGNSLAGSRGSPVADGNPDGRAYSAGATSTVTVAGATAQTSVVPGSATIGGTVSYTGTAVLPAGVNFYNLSLIEQLPAGIDATSVVPGAVDCANADSTACTPAAAGRLSASAGPGTSTLIGWLLGDVPYASQVRTVRVHYTARVADVAAASAGAVLANSIRLGWDNAARTPPASAAAAFQQSSPNAAASVTVAEPGLSVAKAVSRLHPEPGQSFTYTVTVSNRNTAPTSAGYTVTVTDTVPAGVVVDPASISAGGTISGADPVTGGGVLSWSLPGPVAKGAALPGLTYTATLAPSGSVTAAALVNTARITGYDSLPAGGRHYTGPSATASITPFFPRLTTTKSTPAGSTGYIGESFGWLITVRNTGSGVGYQIATTDALPPNWTYDAGSARVSVAGGPATPVEPAVSTAGSVQTLSWTGLGTLNPAGVLSIALTATPQPGVSGSPGVGLAVNHTNSASSVAQDATGATANGAGSYTAGPGSAVAHIGSADLSLTKTVSSAPVAGGTGSWTLTVRNAGPNPATGPFTVTDRLTDPLPSGVGGISASGAGWSCGTAVPVSCQRTAAGDTLASGASFPAITLVYSVDPSVPDGSTLASTAGVSARTQDPNPADNSASTPAVVRASADLAITTSLA
ncbi:MAG: large repetitive protein, partial [Pseudonocardiales bacterium]|nr:large repetitive protein [Pseudonocardiales bacterium]